MCFRDWAPWARQVGAWHSSLFKFCHTSIHIAVVQSTIPTNWDKFTINFNTVIMARCSSRENSIIISMKIVTYRNYVSVCMHWPPGDWLVTLSKPKVNRFFPPLEWLQQQLLYSYNKNLCITSGLHLVHCPGSLPGMKSNKHTATLKQ
jgi:hypothetical protein